MTRIREEIKSKYPNIPKAVKLDFLQLDMNDLSKVQASAQEFLKRDLPLHILVNNSGITGAEYTKNADDIEQVLVINYLGSLAYTGFASSGIDSNPMMAESSLDMLPFE
ncbi:hypothetical protein BGX27_002819 [Mortierella sp. AM989]|nr:hypothetical protein BGX27_002819 [Mortierella sp. AM989]